MKLHIDKIKYQVTKANREIQGRLTRLEKSSYEAHRNTMRQLNEKSQNGRDLIQEENRVFRPQLIDGIMKLRRQFYQQKQNFVRKLPALFKPYLAVSDKRRKHYRSQKKHFKEELKTIRKYARKESAPFRPYFRNQRRLHGFWANKPSRVENQFWIGFGVFLLLLLLGLFIGEFLILTDIPFGSESLINLGIFLGGLIVLFVLRRVTAGWLKKLFTRRDKKLFAEIMEKMRSPELDAFDLRQKSRELEHMVRDLRGQINKML